MFALCLMQVIVEVEEVVVEVGSQSSIVVNNPSLIFRWWSIGANTLSLFSKHCSRSSPVVYAFRTIEAKAAGVGPFYLLSCIREAETDQEVLRFWG